MNFVKKILLTFIVIIMLTTLAIWSLTKNITPSAVKDLINKQLSVLTLESSHIDGDITWQLFPRPGMKITQIHVGENNKNANYSLSIDNLLFNLQIASLLRGQLIFNEIQVDGLKITINPYAPSTNNAKQNNNTETMATHTKNEQAKMLATFAIDSILLTRGHVTIMQLPNKLTLSDLQIGITQLNLKNKFFPLQLKTILSASIAENKIKATLYYKGRMCVGPSILTAPLTALQHAIMNGQLLIQNLQVNAFNIDKIHANVKIKKEEITLNPFNLSLYDGESVGDLNYQFSSKKLSINQTATSLDANQLVTDLFANNLIKGDLDVAVHMSTQLQDSSWQHNLHGNGSLTIKNGILYFIDLNKLLDEAINKIHTLLNQGPGTIKYADNQRLVNSTTYQQNNTKFQLLTIQYHLLDNKLIYNSLLLQTDKVQLKGSGQVNLNDATQDLNLSAKLVSNDNAINTIQQLLGGSFPLKVSGKFTQPQISANTQELDPIISNYLLRNTLKKPIKQINNQLKYLLNSSGVR